MQLEYICLIAASLSVLLNTIIPYVMKLRKEAIDFDIKYIYAGVVSIFSTYLILIDSEITSPITMFMCAFLSASGINMGTKFGVKQMNVAQEMSATKEK